MFFHGTNKKFAKKIINEGLNKSSYVTTEFEFAAGYALRQGNEAVILYFDENIKIESPQESAYWGEVEFITKEKYFPSKILIPKFNSLPSDYYELNDDISDRKYPEFFSSNSWQENNV